MSWLCDKWYNSSPGYCNNISSRYSFCWFAWWYSWTYYCGSYKIRYARPEQAFCEWGRPITQWSTRQLVERPSIPIIPVAKRLEAHLVKWSMKKGNSNYTFHHINLWLFTVIHLFSSTFGTRFVCIHAIYHNTIIKNIRLRYVFFFILFCVFLVRI